MRNTGIAIVAEIKSILPTVSKDYIRKAMDQGLTVQKAHEVADITKNFPVSAHHMIKLKRETDLSNNDLLNILEVWEELSVLSIKSLRKLYELCDRDVETFEHAMSEFVLPYVIADVTKGWQMATSRAMAQLLGALERHIDDGGSILDFEM